MAHHFILDVYVSPNRKYVNLSIIYYIADFSFFMSQDDAYFHIHQNDPAAVCMTNVNGFSLCSSVYWPLRTLISAFDLAAITISYQSFLGPYGIPTKEV